MDVRVPEKAARNDPARPTAFVRTLGCKVNRAESEQFAAALLGSGVRLVNEAEASVVIVNTCTVTGEADRKARKAVRHALASPSGPVVVVTGCLAALDADGLEAIDERVVVVAEKEHVAARVSLLLGGPAHEGAAVTRTGDGFRIRTVVKVEDGCDSFCTYCVVPYARGAPRSVSLDDVLEEVRRVRDAGTAEVVLTGINIGRYRHDDIGLAGLVEAVAQTGIARIRISSIEPLDLTDELIDVLAATPQVCRHLHVPLQSGSDTVLRAMGRCYDVAAYRRRVEAARMALPGLSLTTDVMVGFPGEQAQDVAMTVSLVRELEFTRLHVFRYSKRAGTPAASLPEQVDAVESARRARTLRAEDARLRRVRARERAGQEAELLVEEVSVEEGVPVALGTTSDYLRVRLKAAGLSPGELVSVRLGTEHDGILSAEVA